METSFAEADLEILVDTKLNMSRQYSLVAKMVGNMLGSSRRSIVNRSREVMFSLCSGLMGYTQGIALSSGLPSTRHWLTGESPAQGLKNYQGTEVSSVRGDAESVQPGEKKSQV